METPNFRIYYDGGATYAGDPWNAPAWGVLCIVEADSEHGRRIACNGDYYIWRDERWWDVDFIGLIDYLAQSGARKVLIGRLVSNDEYGRVYQAANNDPDFVPHTAYGNQEKRR